MPSKRLLVTDLLQFFTIFKTWVALTHALCTRCVQTTKCIEETLSSSWLLNLDSGTWRVKLICTRDASSAVRLLCLRLVR